MLDPIEWLCQNAPGFRELQDNERAAIMHFALLWSLFEAEALDTKASAKAIMELARQWTNSGRDWPLAFEQSLEYFRSRCEQAGGPEAYSVQLSLRPRDGQTLVLSVLSSANRDRAATVSALFIIIYRIRNNLFHGEKWASRLRDQLGNFTHSNHALMAAIKFQRQVDLGQAEVDPVS